MFSVFTDRSSQRLEEALFAKLKQSIEAVRGGKSPARRVILVVPAQFTLKAEELAFEKLGGPGFFDFHIMSGNKLEQEIIRETGGPGLTPVDTLGRTMLLRKIALKNASSFKRFSRSASSREFLKLAGDFTVQLKQNDLGPKDIEALLSDLDPKSLLYEKLHDMKIITEGYEEAMKGRFTDAEDLLAFVTEKIPASAYVRSSEIWYHGFYSFTKRDCAFLAALAECSAGLSMMLPLGEGEEGDEELFRAPLKTLGLLKGAAAKRGVPFRAEALTGKSGTGGQGAADGAKDTIPLLISCSDPFTQARTVGTEILRLVREEGVSFGEIAVLTADAPGRAETLARVLSSLEIPVFMDSKRSVMHSPAAALVSALLDMAADGLKPASVIGFMKQGLADLAPEGELRGFESFGALTGEFENYARSYRLRGKAFLEPLRYGKNEYSEEEFAELEALRAKLCGLISPFLSSFKEAASCGDRCRALYTFLDEGLALPRVLEALSLSLTADGFADAAEETAQAWQSICGLLDQSVLLMGEEKMSAADFRDMIEDALSDISIGVLPQAEGRVQLGTVTRSRLQGIKVLFAADMNDGLIPRDMNKEALLTEKELEGLEEMGYTLSKRNEALAAEERLAVHQALSTPAERKYLCWCVSAEGEDALKPSPLIEELKERFPGIREIRDIENRSAAADMLQSGAAAAQKISTELRKAADAGRGAEGLPPLWQAVYNGLKKRKDPAAEAAEQALFYDTASPALSDERVKGLFSDGGSFSFSPSRLEKFSACPFSHFVRYGLAPDEQRVFEIDGSAVGSVHHEALLRLSQRLSAPAVEAGTAITDPTSLWMSISDDDLAALLGQILDELKETGFGGLLSAGAAESYRSGRIQMVCLDFARQMVDQVRRGSISSMYFETGFGRGKKLPPLKISTSLGTVCVEGRIDRIDVLEGSGGRYIKVLDYKSGEIKFDRDKIKQGLSLQLSTYLEGAAGGGAKPAGMFYFQIKEPGLEASLDELMAGGLSERLAEAVKKEYSLSGMVVDEPEVLGAIDRSIPEEGRSDMIGYKTTPKGEVKCSALISSEELDRFREEFRSTLASVCRRLTAGEISPRPRPLDDRNGGCMYCGYRAVCLYGMR